jgi:hypothetical protein
MDKRKVLNSFVDGLFAVHQENTPDEDFYPVAKTYLKKILQSGTYDKEEIVDDILFFIFYIMDKYTFHSEVPMYDVVPKDLPHNYNRNDLDAFNSFIHILMEQFEEAATELGLKSPISIQDFEFIYEQTTTLTKEIPAIWLNA